MTKRYSMVLLGLSLATFSALSYSACQPAGTGEKYAYINGILTSASGAYAEAMALQSTTGKPITLVYNLSRGQSTDMSNLVNQKNKERTFARDTFRTAWVKGEPGLATSSLLTGSALAKAATGWDDPDFMDIAKGARQALAGTNKAVLIGYSQGSIYANQVARAFINAPAGGISAGGLGVFHIASVADFVENGGRHMTSRKDMMVRGLDAKYGVLDANITLDFQWGETTGHDLIRAYLKTGKGKDNIKSNLNAVLAALPGNTTAFGFTLTGAIPVQGRPSFILTNSDGFPEVLTNTPAAVGTIQSGYSGDYTYNELNGNYTLRYMGNCTKLRSRAALQPLVLKAASPTSARIGIEGVTDNRPPYWYRQTSLTGNFTPLISFYPLTINGKTTFTSPE